MAVLGMKGSGSFADGERPYSYREAIMYLFPNGDAPLTALMSKMGRDEALTDPEFYWYDKGLPVYRSTMRAVGEGTALPTNGATIALGAGTTSTISIRIQPNGGTADDTSIIKVGHVLYNETANENYLVLKKASSGGTNYLICQRNIGALYTIGSTDPLTTSGAAGTGNELSIVGSGFPEGAELGAAIAYQPRRYVNYSQIFRTPLFLTRTALKTRLRWDSEGPYKEAKREALRIHGTELERAFMFGRSSRQTSFTNPDAPLDVTATGQPLRTMSGVLSFLATATTTSVSAHTDLATLNSGNLTEDIADDFFEETFRFGSPTKLGLVGSTALNALTKMAKNKMEIQAVPRDQTYGMRITSLISPFGELMLVNHPLLSHNAAWRQDLYVIDTDFLRYRYVTDTVFLTNRQSPGQDATKDEYLTECSLEMHHGGAAPDTSDSSLDTTTGDAAHGRLSGIANYVG